MTAYYNEFDPKAAAWLRELIRRNLIAPGVVDERSIEDVQPDDLRGFTQCHFFAGIGVWSYALRNAGWPDDRPVWTGSCPCQPFSAAGKGGGFADERHLWPAFHWLIEQCRPAVVFGEQVASKDGLAWIDLVQTDLEGTSYTSQAIDLCAAGVGAPHIRQRLWWVAERLDYTAGSRHVRSLENSKGGPRYEARLRLSGSRRGTGRLADAEHAKRGPIGQHGEDGRDRQDNRREKAYGFFGTRGEIRGLVYDQQQGLERHARNGDESHEPGWLDPNALGSTSPTGEFGGLADAAEFGWVRRRSSETGDEPGSIERSARLCAASSRSPTTGPVNGHWRAADWLFCRDGKWRPVSPKPQQMVDGAATGMGRVRADRVRELEFEIVEWARRYEVDAGEAVYDLRQALSAEAQREWPAGRLPELHEAPFLLAFLRQLAQQGWAFAERISGESAETSETRLRMLRDAEAVTRASCERGLDGQPTGERADALRVLSSILARHTSEAWLNAYEAHASIGFPLERNGRARVVRLRGYGNAIVAPAAQVFIEAYLATQAERSGHLRLTEMSEIPTDKPEGIFA